MSIETRRGLNPGKRMLSFLMVLFVLTLGIGIGTLISYRVGAIGPGDSQLKIHKENKPLAGGAALSLSQAFEEVAKLVEPAVVNVNTEEVVSRSRRNPRTQGRDPFEEFLPFFNMPEQYKRTSLGSGVIVDPKGYILTNNHVVESATKVKVSLSNGEEYTARIIAGDDLSDIAVIKIDGNKEFPSAKIGDAKALKVGDWVLAIGSPFGLEQTVTAGIISATGRVFPDLNPESMAMLFNDYLQTDAAINRGNSGGPLVNIHGEVVGLNTFIHTPSGASAGVGFAIPSHILVNVYNQIIDKGKVSRGWLGVNMNSPFPFTPVMAKYFGVRQGKGVLITGLSDETAKPSDTGPAARGGVRPEDVVIEFDGKQITDVQDFRLAVANTPPGKRVRIKVVRKGEEKELEVTVGERKLEDRDRSSFSFEEKEEPPRQEIGLEFDDAPPRLLREINEESGALVKTVKPGSLAEEAGLISQDNRVTDVIIQANGKKVASAQDLFTIIKGLRSGEGVVLKFARLTASGVLTHFTSIVKP